MHTIRLKNKEERRILRGHPWIFSNEIQKIPQDVAPGELVDVVDHGERFVGRAYINPHTLIAARVLTRNREDINAEFIARRISTAHKHREMLGFGRSYRAFFSEGDGLPGLIVDKYEDTLVVQSSTAGIDLLLRTILSALQQEYAPKAIVLRNDVQSREIEGLPQGTSVVYGTVPDPVVFEESGVKYQIDVLTGQKTGFFFDQRENRAALKGLVNGRRTLDCFCYVGAWSLNAARFGAQEVIGIDSSRNAVSLAEANAALNGLNAQFVKADVFDELRRLEKNRELFGCIILDPPAFVKSRAKVREGLKGYKEINLLAMKLLEQRGILFTCSCSHHIDQDLFREMLLDAAHSARRQVRLLEMRSQARDHPIMLAARETQYLKCAILQVN